MDKKSHFITWFNEINNEDAGLFGKKAAAIGELVANNIFVPKGFIINPSVFGHHLKDNKIDLKIKHIISNTNFNHLESLHNSATQIKKIIIDSEFSKEFLKSIRDAYQVINEPLVSIKYSYILNDNSKQNFTKQPDTILNIKGESVLIHKIKESICSIFEPKELFYRHNHQINQNRIEFALIVQEIIDADSSGVINTIDYLHNDKSSISINAVYGHFDIAKNDTNLSDIYKLKKEDLTILNKSIYAQKNEIKIIDLQEKIISIDSKLSGKQKITDKQIIELAIIGKNIEKYMYFPQSIEWCISKNNIYVLQTNPISSINNSFKKLKDNSLLMSALLGNKGIKSGVIKIINNQNDINSISENDILIIKEIKSNYLKFINKASAVIFESSNKNIKILFSSGSIEIPCIYGASDASKLLSNGDVVTVNGTKGEVYKGGYHVANQATPITTDKTATKIYAQVTNTTNLKDINPNIIDGIGYLNSEKILKSIGIHPEKLLKDKKEDLYINSLSEYIVQFCKLLSPKPIIFQTLNTTTTDLIQLEGGSEFESPDINPEIGFRGAFRYIHNSKIFNLELSAIKKVRDEFGYKNLWIMIPYIRNTEELAEVKQIIIKSGLERSASLKLFMSVEIPSNAFQIEDFVKVGIDGISINYESLHNLLMGTDKNNFEIVAENSKYNKFISNILNQILINSVKKELITSIFNIPGINNDLIKDLVLAGINSICVKPEEIDNTRKILIQSEKEFINNR